MRNAITQDEKMMAYYEFQKDNIKSLVTQILKSPELTSEMNKLSSTQKEDCQTKIDEIAEKVIEKEIDYYVNKFKIKTSDDFADTVEKLSEEDITSIRERMCKESIREV